jgi:hypothetical protein
MKHNVEPNYFYNILCSIMPKILGGFCQLQASLQNTAENTAPKSVRAASRAGSQSEPLFTQRQAARRLLFVVDNMRAGDFQTRF